MRTQQAFYKSSRNIAERLIPFAQPVPKRRNTKQTAVLPHPAPLHSHPSAAKRNVNRKHCPISGTQFFMQHPNLYPYHKQVIIIIILYLCCRNLLIIGMRFLLLFLTLLLQFNVSGYNLHNPLKDCAEKTLTSENQEFNTCNDRHFRYQGQYEDVETGLYYNRFRYYDPSIDAYLSQDPIGLLGGNPTLYGYVKDVNSWLDIFGLSRRGNNATQTQNQSLRNQFLSENPGARHAGGSVDIATGKNLPETYLPPNTQLASTRAGGSYADLTFDMPDGTRVYVQTVDRGRFFGMSQREWDNANRILRQDPDAIIITVKKGQTLTAGELDVNSNNMRGGNIYTH